jgi:hypothetical protein
MFEPINAPTDDPQSALQKIETTAGAARVDDTIREAIEHCWITMPPHKQNAAAVSAEIRRLVNQALRDLQVNS